MFVGLGPGLVVTADDSCLGGRGFEYLHRLLDRFGRIIIAAVSIRTGS